MATPIISIHGLGKCYRLGVGRTHDTLRDHLVHSFGSLAGRLNSRQQTNVRASKGPLLWALKNVSFDVSEGEVIGIIGRNGAGKSTLLKILSQITDPTEGEVRVRGRMASLLEVGTGFHPELTGRENIYLNGSILGMRKSEIRRKFDEIVNFAEVEKFLDTPVKHYSSGMYLRLAFAVAAHLEPDILVIDEVLAVGDVAFQKKCLSKMDEVAAQGRTVLFVSHNLGAIARLCSRTILLKAGEVSLDGRSIDVIKQYCENQFPAAAEWTRRADDAAADFAFESVRLTNRAGTPSGVFDGDEAVSISLRFSVRKALPSCQVGLQVLNSEGIVVFTTSDGDVSHCPALSRVPGQYETVLEIPGNLLTPGVYTLFIAAHNPKRAFFDKVDQKVGFEITSSGALAALDGRLGAVTPLLTWHTKQL